MFGKGVFDDTFWATGGQLNRDISSDLCRFLHEMGHLRLELPFDFVLDREVIEDVGKAVRVAVIFWGRPETVATPNLPGLLLRLSALLGNDFENIEAVERTQGNNPWTSLSEDHHFDLIVGEPEIVGPTNELEMLSDHGPDV